MNKDQFKVFIACFPTIKVSNGGEALPEFVLLDCYDSVAKNGNINPACCFEMFTNSIWEDDRDRPLSFDEWNEISWNQKQWTYADDFLSGKLDYQPREILPEYKIKLLRRKLRFQKRRLLNG